MRNELRYVLPLFFSLLSATAEAEDHDGGGGTRRPFADETIPFRRTSDDSTPGGGKRVFLPKVECEMTVIRYKESEQFNSLVPIKRETLKKQVQIKIPQGTGRRISFLGSMDLKVDGHKYGVSLRTKGDPDFSKDMPVIISVRAYTGADEVLGHDAATVFSRPSDDEEPVISFSKEMDGRTKFPVHTSLKCTHQAEEELP